MVLQRGKFIKNMIEKTYAINLGKMLSEITIFYKTLLLWNYQKKI